MSPGNMLSTSFPNASQTMTLPKLAANGSNWIVWKNHILIWIHAKNLSHMLDNSVAIPTKPEPLSDSPTAKETATFTTASKKYQVFDQSNAAVKHFITSTIPDSLFIKTTNCTPASSLWKKICSEHEVKTQQFTIEMHCNLQNQCCSETNNIRQHFSRMIKHCAELVTTGKIINEANFTSIITNFLPPSYNNIISAAYSAAITIGKEVTTDPLISVIQEEHSCQQIISGTPHTSTALFSNPQKPSLRRSGQQKPRKPDVCTNQQCRYCHTHELKDCCLIGGLLHGQNPPSYSQATGHSGGQWGRWIRTGETLSKSCEQTSFMRRRIFPTSMLQLQPPHSALPTLVLTQPTCLDRLRSMIVALAAICPSITATLLTSPPSPHNQSQV